MARRLPWLTLLGLTAGGLPGALAQTGPANVTCTNNADDQAIYTSSTGALTFQILCGVDYGGGDTAATSTDTFAGCIEACAGTSGCIDVSYVSPSCYMKSQLGTPENRDWVWTAKQVAPGPSTVSDKLSCDDNASDGQTYKAGNGTDSFLITCGKDYAGGDLLGLSAATFEDCIDACDSHPECVNVAYVYGACYLKQQQEPAVNNTAVWGAIRQQVSATGSATTTTATSTATATASSTPSSTPLSCENNASNLTEYTSAKNGGKYQILCGVDFGGGDLLGTTTASFEDCIAACDDNADCIDVSYVAPSCYLKKTLGDPSQVSYVWTAKQLVAPGTGSGNSTLTLPVQCPQWDNQTYTDDNNNQWLVRCNHDYENYDITQTWTDTIEECMDWCAGVTDCAVASWIPQSPDSIHRNCYAKTQAGPARDGIYHSMVLISQFELVSVVYGVIDVTSYAAQRWLVGNRIQIDTNGIVNDAYTPNEDPLYGTPKSISVLYRAGAELRSWVGRESTGTFVIRPGPVTSAPSSSMLPAEWGPSDGTASTIQIVEVTYGQLQIRDRGAWDRLYHDAAQGGGTPAMDNIFYDSWYGVYKSLVVFFRYLSDGADGPIHARAAVEYNDIALPGPNGDGTDFKAKARARRSRVAGRRAERA